MKRFLACSLMIFLTLNIAQADEPRETFLKDFRLSDGSYKKLGFRIDNIKKGSLFDRIGLKNGDIIKQVNQRPISNSQDTKYVFHEIKTAKKVNLLILRNGQEIPIRYKIK